MTESQPTFTIFSDADSPGWAEAFAALLREWEPAVVEVVATFDAALNTPSDVLILNPRYRRDEELSAEHIASIGSRRIVAMALGANWLCRQIDEFEILGGNRIHNVPLVVHDSKLLGRWTSKTTIDPFAKEWDVPPEEQTPLTPCIFFADSSLADYRAGVEYIAGLEGFDESAVVMRQANFVFAGVMAHPEEWSTEYRELMQRVCFALPQKSVEVVEPIVVPRQLHPPGTVKFELGVGRNKGQREFFFQFEKPTVFTATLEQTGSSAMALNFSGGKEGLYGTRDDTFTGQTLSITANIRAAAIDAVGYRYWRLSVSNFDPDYPASVRLTVAYDTDESKPAILPLPGNMSFEYLVQHCVKLNRRVRAGDKSVLERFATHASSLDPQAFSTARRVTAREHGFETWEIISRQVVWRSVFMGEEDDEEAQEFYDRARVYYRDSFSLWNLVEYAGDFAQDLVATLASAFEQAVQARHPEFTEEHLLLALLNNPVATHVLKSVGCDLTGLHNDLSSRLDVIANNDSTGAVQVSREMCRAVFWASSVTALGQEGTNAANLLAGLYYEKGSATELLAKRSARLKDVLNYLSHGIASQDVDVQDSNGSVFHADVEKAARIAFSNAYSSRDQHVTADHLLLALLDSTDVQSTLASIGADIDAIRNELSAIIDEAIPVVKTDNYECAPTRVFNRVMQITIEKSRRSDHDAANAVDALWALCGERDTPFAEILSRHNVLQSEVETHSK